MKMDVDDCGDDDDEYEDEEEDNDDDDENNNNNVGGMKTKQNDQQNTKMSKVMLVTYRTKYSKIDNPPFHLKNK